MSFKRALIASALALCGSGAAAQSSPQLYDFKGVPLEISLDEFRALPHPDGDPARVVCTGEKVGDGAFSLEPTNVRVWNEIEKSLGIKKCIWIGTREDRFFKDRQASLSFANSGYGAYDYAFSFIPDPSDGIMKLFKFEGSSNTASTTAVIEAITTKFGEPEIIQSEVQNRIGNSFPKVTAIWDNSSSILVVEDKYSKIDNMRIVLTASRLNKIVADATEAADATKPNPI